LGKNTARDGQMLAGSGDEVPLFHFHHAIQDKRLKKLQGTHHRKEHAGLIMLITKMISKMISSALHL
jgi:hypothetical protein